mmetsp:Transcript_61761/g.137881  ORF Transcript_61761/g.137881 Transcript_61761/m.137881 type:complete len:86 (-) Transcript_61761:1621-1878(-)
MLPSASVRPKQVQQNGADIAHRIAEPWNGLNTYLRFEAALVAKILQRPLAQEAATVELRPAFHRKGQNRRFFSPRFFTVFRASLT